MNFILNRIILLALVFITVNAVMDPCSYFETANLEELVELEENMEEESKEDSEKNEKEEFLPALADAHYANNLESFSRHASDALNESDYLELNTPPPRPIS